jgi:23S rRNA pseudouridine2605 synthase
MAQGFNKFMGKGDSGAKKKERIRQEKKKLRQETKEYFEKKKQEARDARSQGQAGGYQSQRGRNEQAEKKGTGDRKPSNNFKQQGERKATSFRPQAVSNPGKATGYKPDAEKKDTGDRKPASNFRPQGERKATSFKPQGKAESYKPKRESNTRQGASFKPQGEKPAARHTPYAEKKATSFKPQAASNTKKAESFKPKVESNIKAQKPGSQPPTTNHKPQTGKLGSKPETTTEKPEKAVNGLMPLNKFIAHAGICSRRDAAELVKDGKVVVNGDKIMDPGHKVTDKDEIKVNGKKLALRRNLVYILINKPKDFITTTEDPQGRKTVLDLIRHATDERVYPIGRLDRNTTGVLLLTNDGELAQKLSHPSYEIRKIYEVKLDKPLVKKDFETIMNGITLEDGLVTPDALAYADPKDKSVIGIEIHSGRNRIVRRIFEQLGYDVRNLDRVMYANLTKKNVDRGKWRFLTEKEVRLLKYLNSSYTKTKTVARG